MSEELTFNAYQQATNETAIYPGAGSPEGLLYALLGAIGELGELCKEVTFKCESRTTTPYRVVRMMRHLGIAAEQVKKTLRDHEGVLPDERRHQLANALSRLNLHAMNEEDKIKDREEVVPWTLPDAVTVSPSFFKEQGDVCWYMARLSRDVGLNLGEVAQANLDKLRSRKERGVLSGDGGER